MKTHTIKNKLISKKTLLKFTVFLLVIMYNKSLNHLAFIDDIHNYSWPGRCDEFQMGQV
jgi:hypothetical protein